MNLSRTFDEAQWLRGAGAIRRELTEALRALECRLARLRSLDATQVHETRKQLKRARAVLALLEPSLDPRHYDAIDLELRDAGRSLAHARDRAVLADTYARLAAATGVVAEPTPVTARADAGPPVARTEAAPLLPGLRRTVARLTQAPVCATGWPALGTGMHAIYRRARRSLPPRGREPTARQLHELRKHSRRYWHALEVLEPLNPRRIAAATRRLHRLSDLLGEEHDLAVLSLYLRERRPVPSKLDDAVLDAAARRRRRLSKKALALAAALYADRPRMVVADLHRKWQRARRRARRG